MNDLPQPPNVPEWFEIALSFISGDSAKRYFRAAVYAQLWREEAKRIHTMATTPLTWSRDLQAAKDNAEICAHTMRADKAQEDAK